MTEERKPWWYSGADAEQPPTSPPGPEAAGVPTMDWTALAGGAQRLIDWATDRVLAPHAEHDDPHAHPQCVVCRTMLLLGERASPAREDDSPSPATSDDIAWIPIVGDCEEP